MLFTKEGLPRVTYSQLQVVQSVGGLLQNTVVVSFRWQYWRYLGANMIERIGKQLWETDLFSNSKSIHAKDHIIVYMAKENEAYTCEVARLKKWVKIEKIKLMNILIDDEPLEMILKPIFTKKFRASFLFIKVFSSEGPKARVITSISKGYTYIVESRYFQSDHQGRHNRIRAKAEITKMMSVFAHKVTD